MTPGLAYLDSSAAVKLIVSEPEGVALRRWLTSWPHRVSSELAAIEVVRTVRRRDPHAIGLVDTALSLVALRPITDEVVVLAGLVHPATLKTLDAIHLATAIMLREAIGCFVTYDERLATAARAVGLRVAAPA